MNEFLKRNEIRKKQKAFARSGDWTFAVGDRVQEVSHEEDWPAGTITAIEVEEVGTDTILGTTFPRTKTFAVIQWDDLGKPDSRYYLWDGKTYTFVPHEDYFKDDAGGAE